ncbi:MAG: LD-carboxypeptidase [Lentisphaerae bacterium]|nr:LD-carboxypeptidase [Lentisphaerota bacterium]
MKKLNIALVAPSGWCSKDTVLKGKTYLEKRGAQVRVMPHISTRNSLAHLSASDELRAADINAALADEKINMLWAVRGGCGALRILDRIDWELFRKRQLPFAGFSDITAIHYAMAKKGINSFIAAPMMKFLGEAPDALTEKSLDDALKNEPLELELEAFRAGTVIKAAPLAGNITVACALCGTEYFPDTKDRLLILEEVGEAPYRIERSLTQLRLAGAFEKCAGVVFGSFTSCGEKAEQEAVLRDFAGSVQCPVFHGLPHGHEMPFVSVSGGQRISVRSI